jgi:uracil-DNA glycosylase family 4
VTASAGRDTLQELEREIVACARCPRLRRHCREIARVRRRAYRDETYWGRPVPGFGDPAARILALGLAPAAHGANRTGRMFTGDRSGEWLYRALHRAGLANRTSSIGRDDGLALRGIYVSAACRCAPPGNRPTPRELAACAAFLDREIALLRGLRVVLALGGVAWKAALRCAARAEASQAIPAHPSFAHGARTRARILAGGPTVWIVGSYHPSQQNTFTGRLTAAMLDDAVQGALELAGGLPRRPHPRPSAASARSRSASESSR